MCVNYLVLHVSTSGSDYVTLAILQPDQSLPWAEINVTIGYWNAVNFLGKILCGTKE